ncbi:MAG TPA: SagB/ThcOx family dehydrogenase [Thermodesulfobacteriota bacterium]|nr:SagB/ThcOx family dehydrogenase [Deltaproteobacteria bacterium]HNR12091.1 SagB/ThcOx family dehydrogenase [Thermodesulfobacteriota bacterium]HNU70835.1 SagB/ThcOx family dehydrogenase [Thermodesulfobacteriota bacterium]HOC39102.1 SagB/ThcOx family dehydrogenase [Thermodesulfobacteriota bacterium]HQO77464.1 SagB/ThcOx family dehydrogenase [Thermodesulfobacteriota bacterium]
MKRNTLLAALITCLALMPAGFLSADDWGGHGIAPQDTKALATIQLPAPQVTNGLPLLQVLLERKSQRSFSTRKLPMQILGNLLWSGFGVNRVENGKRTAPSSQNKQETDIYVALEEGLYYYDAMLHQLQLVSTADLREETAAGRDREYVASAPVDFIYVADTSKQPEETTCFADTGFIAQNVYLCCASENLAVVVRGGVPRDELAQVMGLAANQIITLCQTIGYVPGQEPNEPADVTGDGIIDATSVIVDQDRNRQLSVGDTFTHWFENETIQTGTLDQGHIDWIVASGQPLTAAGLQAAANALNNGFRWSGLQLVSPGTI